MYVLVTYKKEDDQIKNEGARVITLKLYFRCSRAANSVVGGLMQPKLKLIQAFMVVLATCKNEKIQSENEGVRVITK